MGQKEQSIHRNIIEAAKTIFGTEGYRSASIEMIAEEAGVTQLILNRHFSSKEDLFIAVSESAADEVKSSLLKVSADEEFGLKEKLVGMTNYLIKKAPFDFYLIMNGVQQELSREEYSYLYELWQTSYQQPFIDLFESHEQMFKDSLSPAVAASHYFLMMSPYINNENNADYPLPADRAIELFLDEATK